MSSLRFFILIALFLSLPSIQATTALTVNPAEFDAFVEEVMHNSSIPGAAVVVFDEFGITYERAYGRINNSGAPATLDTPFQLGSVSKSFAALIIVQLHAEQKLHLDIPVTEYLPALDGERTVDWSKITLRQILSHQSGLSMLDGNRMQASSDRSEDVIQRAIEWIANLKPSSSPGERFEYSNANYMILAAVIEQLERRPYELVVSTRIFKPLQMNQSYVQLSSSSVNTEAVGYRQWYGRPVQYRFVPGRIMAAPGGVTASARDLATYVRAVSNRDPTIVPEAFSEELIASIAPGSETGTEYGYGYGWMVADIDGERVVFHSGLNGGFAAHAAFLPKHGTGAVAVSNLSGSQVADVPGVIVRRALGVETGHISPTLTQRLTLWSLTAGALVFLSGAVSSLKHLLNSNKQATNWITLILPSIVLLGVSYGLLMLAPESNGVPLGAIKVFQPDIWLGLTVGGFSALVWSISRLVSGLQSRNQSNGSN